MKKHIHIHIPAKKPQVAYLMRLKSKDAVPGEVGGREWIQLDPYKNGSLCKVGATFKYNGMKVKVVEVLPAYLVKPGRVKIEYLETTKDAGTQDSSLSELQSKRDKLEAEFDKADDSGDNRALDRIRKELSALDAEIKKQKEQKAATKDEKLIKTLSGTKTMVKVYYDDGWKEFQAKLYYKKPFGWQEQNKASYHSDDKEDALSTAADMLRRAEARTKD